MPPWWLSGKESACQYRRHSLHHWVGKIPRRSKWQHTQYSCWEIPWTEEPGRLQSMESQKSQTQLSNKTTTLKVMYLAG